MRGDDLLHRADRELSEPARVAVHAASRELPADDALPVALSRFDESVAVLAQLEAVAATAPGTDAVEKACNAMLLAASAHSDAERTADALSADRVQFLETSLEFYDRHGTQPCPVCAEGTLDDGWVTRARASLTAERDAASALRVARSGAHRARHALTALVRAVEAPGPEDARLAEIAPASVAYQSFSVLPVDDDVALARHVARELPELRRTYVALGSVATRESAAAREAQAWLRTLA